MSLPTRPILDWFSVGAQLLPDDVSAAAQQGYRAIINNRPDGEAGPEQPSSAAIAAAAEAAGLAYAHLPIATGTQPTEEQIQATVKLLQTLPRPILAFCRSGTRSTNVFQQALAREDSLN